MPCCTVVAWLSISAHAGQIARRAPMTRVGEDGVVVELVAVKRSTREVHAHAVDPERRLLLAAGHDERHANPADPVPAYEEGWENLSSLEGGSRRPVLHPVLHPVWPKN